MGLAFVEAGRKGMVIEEVEHKTYLFHHIHLIFTFMWAPYL